MDTCLQPTDQTLAWFSLSTENDAASIRTHSGAQDAPFKGRLSCGVFCRHDDPEALYAPDGETQLKQHDLPDKCHSRTYRDLRWHVLSVYRQMFVVLFLVNMTIVIVLAAQGGLDFQQCATGAAVNILTSILARQEHVVNMMFILATSLPLSFPLSIRRRPAKVYSYGGLHSGCGFAGFYWYVAFTAFITGAMLENQRLIPAVILSYVTLALLLLIITFAHPSIRQAIHNQFETTHRFAGWSIVAVYWAQTFLLAQVQKSQSNLTFAQVLARTPGFWCLNLITFSLFYPWVRLRNRDVRVEKLSDHATRLHFSHGTLGRCRGVRLSSNPLVETHAFATIPASPPNKGYSTVISNAGDWTKRLIQDPERRTKIWVKGAPTYGFLHVAKLFKRAVIVATGSRIGPCLALINANDKLDCRVLWSAMSPKTPTVMRSWMRC